MYFMRNGMCSVVNDDTNHEYCVLKQGDFFGATALNMTETVLYHHEAIYQNEFSCFVLLMKQMCQLQMRIHEH
jgi:hypothetical protein